MKGAALPIVLLWLAHSCAALPLLSVPKDVHSNVVRLPLRRSINPIDNHRRRQLPVTLENNEVSYLVDLEVGTPPQSVTLSIDTGSSDIWVFAPEGCNDCNGGVCKSSIHRFLHYLPEIDDPTASSTDEYVDDFGDFSITYFDNSGATGYYVGDTVSIGSATVTNVTLGVATSSTDMSNRYSVMGIGLDATQSSSVKHAGFIDNLYDQGLIASHSYSIYLDDIESNTGSILFGGTDSSKYSGDLVSLPIVPYTDNTARLQVTWTYLSVTDESGTTTQLSASDLSYPVTLDTGYTTTVLPVNMFNYLASLLGASGPDDNGSYYVPCELPSGYLTYGFGDGPEVTINVPFSELAVPLSSGECFFGFLPQDNVVLSFGDTFLRSAYVNYDFDASTIGLAQAVWTW